MTAPAQPRPSVALVTLGCARNDVDSEELAARLELDGWELVADAAEADAVVVNTCGFVESAKKDSVDELLAAADLRDTGRPRAVVAVGCLAERYGVELQRALPEADAVLGFDAYADIGARLRATLAGDRPAAHVPSDRRLLLPLTPVDRADVAGTGTVAVPGHGHGGGAGVGRGPRLLRHRLDDGPTAPLKLASGCDRRCSFCAIPSFRGAFVSRPPDDVLAEAHWLAASGVRELVLVSENSTSYGKDLGDTRALERLLPRLAGVDGVERVRVSYLQPAEMRPTLVEVVATTPGVVPYFDLSFQHASVEVLRRMRRFGGTEPFLALLEQVRALAPDAGVRSNVIVGFPGETERDLAELERFLEGARLDAVGVFGYSDEDGTEAAGLDGKLDAAEVAARVEQVATLAEELTAQRAEDRLGEAVSVLVEHVPHDGPAEGRCAHQGPEVDGSTRLVDGRLGARRARRRCRRGVGRGGPARSPGARGGDAVIKPAPPDHIGDPVQSASVLNIANLLTVLRLLLVPVFAAALFHDGGHDATWRWIAWGVFAVASFTDLVDGELARRRGLVTSFGKIADPIADKALMGTALVGLSLLGDLPWWVTVVVLVREVGVTLLRFWVIRHGVIPASRGGKAKTLLQAVAIGLYILPLTGWLRTLSAVILAAAVVLTLVTGVDYVARALALRRAGRLAEQSGP